MINNRFNSFKNSIYSAVFRNYCSKVNVSKDSKKWFVENRDLDTLEENVLLRNHENTIPLIRKIISDLEKEKDSGRKELLRTRLEKEFNKLPNDTHPRAIKNGNNTKELLRHDAGSLNLSNALQFSEICKPINLLRTEHLSNFNGHKSYYLAGFIAELEHALIQYSLGVLKKKNFKLLSVPDILPKEVIENCGMQTQGERTQVLIIFFFWVFLNINHIADNISQTVI